MEQIKFTVHYRHFLAKDIFHSWINDQISDTITEICNEETCTTYMANGEVLVGIMLGIPLWLRDKLEIETFTGE
jgi:hypothetical protein